jgi:lipoic acid synthetase
MLGLGETEPEISGDDDLREVAFVLTIGQYLRPSAQHLPVVEYTHPDTFSCTSESS